MFYEVMSKPITYPAKAFISKQSILNLIFVNYLYTYLLIAFISNTTKSCVLLKHKIQIICIIGLRLNIWTFFFILNFKICHRQFLTIRIIILFFKGFLNDKFQCKTGFDRYQSIEWRIENDRSEIIWIRYIRLRFNAAIISLTSKKSLPSFICSASISF